MKKFQTRYGLLLLLIAAAVALYCCPAVQGSPIAAPEENRQQQEVKPEVDKHSQVAIESMDLKRISNVTSAGQDQANLKDTQDELDDVASSNLLSVLGGPEGLEDLDSVNRQLMQSEDTHLLSMSLLPGKRRLDDNTALASTGQARGNRFIMPDGPMGHKFQQQLLSDNTNLNSLINEALLDEPKYDTRRPLGRMGGPRAREQGPLPAPMAERRQLNIPRPPKVGGGGSRAVGNGNYLNLGQQQLPGESRNSRRPATTKARSVEELADQDGEQRLSDKEQQEGADIFRDEASPPASSSSSSSSASDKRADEPAVDYDDEDEQQASADEQAENSKALAASNSPMADRSGGQLRGPSNANNPMRGIEDSTSVASSDREDNDEDGESTNLRAKKSRGPVEVEVSGNSAALSEDGGARVEGSSAAAGAGPTTSSDEDEAASQLDKTADLQTAAGHHHGHSHGHYYQYAGVPKKKAWKFGFKRGNHKHTISREEKGYKNKFHSSFKWHATEKCKKHKKCKSMGKMTWHYEHHDKKKKHHHY